jgi:hypothetical protein
MSDKELDSGHKQVKMRFQSPRQPLIGILLSMIGGFCAGLIVGAIWEQTVEVKIMTAFALALVAGGVMALSETGIL